MKYDDLVQRLRECAVLYEFDPNEAADAIVALQADLAAARALLREVRHSMDDLVVAVMCNNRTEAEIAVRRANAAMIAIDAALAGERKECS